MSGFPIGYDEPAAKCRQGVVRLCAVKLVVTIQLPSFNLTLHMSTFQVSNQFRDITHDPTVWKTFKVYAEARLPQRPGSYSFQLANYSSIF